MVELEASAEPAVVYKFERSSHKNILINSSTGTLVDIGIVSESSCFVAVHSDAFAATDVGVEDSPVKRTCTDITNNQSTRASAQDDSSYFEVGKDLNLSN